MARKKTVVRTMKNADEKYLGTEPVLTDNPTNVEQIRAWTWYNYFHDVDRSKRYILDWMRANKVPKMEIESIKRLSKIDIYQAGLNVGWNARILTRGGGLQEATYSKFLVKIENLKKLSENYVQVNDTSTTSNNTISIQSRMRHKSYDLIVDLEELLYGEADFSPYEFLQANASSGAVAKMTEDRWKAELEEVNLAFTKKDDQCVEAYHNCTKKELVTLSKRLQLILDDIERFASNTKKVRKTRKVKETPATKQVEKVKFKETDKELKLQSIAPVSIIGCDHLWVYNTKYKTVTVYTAMGPKGLGMKGTTVQGFDPDSSETRKLRKPEEMLKILLKSTKTKNIKYLKSLTTKPSVPTGRINTETILLKVFK